MYLLDDSVVFAVKSKRVVVQLNHRESPLARLNLGDIGLRFAHKSSELALAELALFAMLAKASPDYHVGCNIHSPTIGSQYK